MSDVAARKDRKEISWRRDIQEHALWSRAETLDEDASLAEGLLVNCLAVG